MTRLHVESRMMSMKAEPEDEDLPQLTGTPKQIAWAMTLRRKALSDVVAYLEYVHESQGRQSASAKDMDLFEAKKERVLEPLTAQTEAAWWIDRRYDSALTLLESVWDQETEDQLSPP